MKATIAKPLSAVILIVSCIVLFLSHDDVVDSIGVFMFLVGTIMLLTTVVIDMVEGW